MDGQIVQQRSSYRQGLVLGLTMAEIMILLVFCLLIAMATFLKREESRRVTAERELQQQRQQKHRRGRPEIEQAAARDRCRERAYAQEAEIDDGIRGASHVPQIEGGGDRAEAH